MEILIKALQFILSLSLLVIIHEAGHFFFAKLFKIRVEKFYLFFNPGFSLFKFRIGETEYGMGWVPFGGYVKISGMIDESMDKEAMKLPPQPYEFRSKPAWQRLLVMTGGVLMNILAAIIIYIGLTFSYGTSYLPTAGVQAGYQFSPLAQEIGFRNGDNIVSVDGKSFDDFADLRMAIIIGSPKEVTIERNGAQQVIPVDEKYISRILKDEFLNLRVPFVVDSVLVDKSAWTAGIQRGDSLVAVDGVSMIYQDEYKDYFAAKAGDSVTVSVVRDSMGVRIAKELTAVVSDSGRIDVTIDAARAILSTYPVVEREYSFFQAIPAGFERTISMVESYFDQLALIFNFKSEAYKQVGSVISMGNFFPAQWDWFRFWNITAFFSVMLAILNILPIPALDGGHVMFLLYEVITRRKPSDKFMEYAQMVGMVLLMLLMFGAFGNDIYKLFK